MAQPVEDFRLGNEYDEWLDAHRDEPDDPAPEDGWEPPRRPWAKPVESFDHPTDEEHEHGRSNRND